MSRQANEMLFSRTSQHLAVASGIGLKLFSFPTMELLHTIEAHPAACTTLDLDPRGRCATLAFCVFSYKFTGLLIHRYIVLGSNDSLASIWDTTEWYCLKTLSKQE